MNQQEVKSFNFGQILTNAEVVEAFAIGDDHKQLVKFFEAKLPGIEKALGQQMDARYLAYMFEFAVSRAGRIL